MQEIVVLEYEYEYRHVEYEYEYTGPEYEYEYVVPEYEYEYWGQVLEYEYEYRNLYSSTDSSTSTYSSTTSLVSARPKIFGAKKVANGRFQEPFLEKCSQFWAASCNCQKAILYRDSSPTSLCCASLYFDGQASIVQQL